MYKINQIAEAIIRMNDASFQELCNHFLSQKYEFTHVSAIGSVIGKEKTKKGTPDAVFTDENGNYIFVEHTTQNQFGRTSSFYKKIALDIKKCFDSNKSGITNRQIIKIIICHTGRLTPKEISTLIKTCQSYNSEVKFEQFGIDDLSINLQDYPTLLETYLNIKAGTGQLVNLDKYIEIYEKPSIRLATPLANIFIGREKEITEGLTFLQFDNLLLISGPSGIGKTKFAIELCSKFISSNKTYELVCLADKGTSAYDDIQNQLINQQDYIILVDDANRTLNYNFILYLLKSTRKGSIKIIVTVRDYALDKVKNNSNEYNYKEIKLEVLSEQVIIEILKSPSFNIQNHRYIDKINSIACGNVRIAIMCASVVLKEKSLYSLDNVSQLYEQYFNEAYNKIKSVSKYALKTLGIISFFRIISKDQTDTNTKIFTTFQIDENEFWDQCIKLNKLEFVDLFEDQVVKISDQILSTYIFYKTFFDTKLLDYGLLINNFIEFKSNFIDSLNPLLIAYDYKNIKDQLGNIFDKEWEHWIATNSYSWMLKIISIFWFCTESKSLSYLENHISNIEKSPNKNLLDNSLSQTYIDHSIDELSILSEFRHLLNSKSRIALELMFLYIEKNPVHTQRLVKILKEQWKFDRFSCENGDFIQHLLVDFLIEKLKKEQKNNLYIGIFKEIVPELLNTRFIDTESKGIQYCMYTHHTILTTSIEKLRKKIWDSVWLIYQIKTDYLYDIIKSLRFENYEGNKKLWAYDSTIVIPLLLQLNYDDFKACEITEHYLQILNWAKVKYDKTIKEIATNKLFKLSKILTNTEERHASPNYGELKRKNIISYCQNLDYNGYIYLFKDITTIIENSINDIRLEDALNCIIESTIQKDHKLFYKVLGYVLKHHSFQLWDIRILNIYFHSKPESYHPLLKTLIKNCTDQNQYWLYSFHVSLPIEYISKNQGSQALLSHFYSILAHIKNANGITQVIEKYSCIEGKDIICTRVIEAFLLQPQLNIDHKFIEFALQQTNIDFVKIKKLYLQNTSHTEHFDCKKSVFIKLLEKDAHFIIEYLDSRHKNSRSLYDYSSEHFELIWNIDNYEEIIMTSINYFIENPHSICGEEGYIAFFMNLHNNKEKAIKFIQNMIDNYYNSEDHISIVFLIIANTIPEVKCNCIERFLRLNSYFEHFRKISFFPRSASCTGSWIPYMQNKMNAWKAILETINGMNMGIKLLKHIEYVEQQIKYCKQNIIQESKNEFMDKYKT